MTAPRPPARKPLRAALLLATTALLASCNMLDKISDVGGPPKTSRIEDPTQDPNYKPVSTPMPAPQTPVTNVNSLIQRVAGTSLAEIENLISELESLRDVLHAEGQRVQREISGYAQLSQAAMKSTRMIADNVAQWKRAADGLRHG